MSTTTRRQFLQTSLIGGAAALAATTVGRIAQADGHAQAHTVTIKGFTFQPAQLTINAGDTVTFVNGDGAPHTATATNRSFDTGRLGRGASATLQFGAAGRYDYFCEIHPRMKGVLTVV
ncbi:cupredoxin domain-containing protein [Jannaschia donghaensis]|uniref:Amicyanin n=1 Tax=Jannaschia donghaensis TaxID=420998 RepID=A0A0M6YMP1_9RHOB|nr:cupredoxin family copper-binding protein [Jannaschia donghaensis]CTQ50306.1 Amicyanin precursor [Jannaschia donghaensis]